MCDDVLFLGINFVFLNVFGTYCAHLGSARNHLLLCDEFGCNGLNYGDSKNDALDRGDGGGF